MQFSSAFLRVCLAHNIRPFFLPAGTTKWLMPLDQVAHATMSNKAAFGAASAEPDIIHGPSRPSLASWKPQTPNPKP